MNHLFPHCTIHHMPQRSEAWREIRKDKLTASQAGEWLAAQRECRLTIPDIKIALDMAGIPYKGITKHEDLLALGTAWPETHLKGTTDARHTAICKILGSMSKCAVPDQWEVDPDGPPPKNPALWAVWNGIRLEKEAVAAFSEWHGTEVIEVGFCVHRSGSAGCSPDGLLSGERIGFEGKAPLPATHVGYLLDPESMIRDYGTQCHFSMAVTGAESWWLQSFCPGLPTARTLIKRDEYTERMQSGMYEFAEHLKSAQEEIASLWDMEFKKGEA